VVDESCRVEDFHNGSELNCELENRHTRSSNPSLSAKIRRALALASVFLETSESCCRACQAYLFSLSALSPVGLNESANTLRRHGFREQRIRPDLHLRLRLVTKVVSKDSYEYTESWGESENSMEPSMSGKDTRVAISKPATSKPAQ
jgi:hypothetical protein